MASIICREIFVKLAGDYVSVCKIRNSTLKDVQSGVLKFDEQSKMNAERYRLIGREIYANFFFCFFRIQHGQKHLLTNACQLGLVVGWRVSGYGAAHRVSHHEVSRLELVCQYFRVSVRVCMAYFGANRFVTFPDQAKRPPTPKRWLIH